MKKKGNPIVIVLAEDDEDDYLLIKEALVESRILNDLYWVRDGEELMDFLNRKNEYCDPETSPFPAIILLDLNMPRKDGREALMEIKSTPELKRIPVVILTTSQSEEDILKSYDLGVNSFIRKPEGFSDFVNVIRTFGQYWFEIVELPLSQDC